MEIDSRLEPLVREALTAVVKRNPERLQTALASFPDDLSLTKGAQLAVAVALYVLQDAYGRKLTEQEIRAVADKLVEQEDWTDLTSDEIATFLTAAYDRTSADRVLPLDRVGPVAFVLAGNLLSSCCKEGEWWFNYLDRAEAVLESAPDPQATT
jgi:hypothetical protein